MSKINLTKILNQGKIKNRVNWIVACNSRKGLQEESPGSIEQWYLITSSEGDLRESATENNNHILWFRWKGGVKAHQQYSDILAV